VINIDQEILFLVKKPHKSCGGSVACVRGAKLVEIETEAENYSF